MDAYVEIAYPDGTTQRCRIEDDEITAGRSPTAGIPLVNAPDLEPEHLLITPRIDGCWIAVAEGASPKLTFGGREEPAALIPWGGEVRLGSLTLVVTDKPFKDLRSDSPIGSPVALAAFICIPLAGWLILTAPTTNIPTLTDAPHPSLFPEAVACSAEGGERGIRGVEAAEAASHRGERYPFDAQEGVRAYRLYLEAESCYRAAGRRGDATRMGREGRALRRRIDEDYQTHRLRFERALEHQRYTEALREVRALNALLRHRYDDPYSIWMSMMERRLRLHREQSLSAREES
jgi:hypothetical protein